MKQLWSHPGIIERLLVLRAAGRSVREIARRLSGEFDARVTRHAVEHKLYQIRRGQCPQTIADADLAARALAVNLGPTRTSAR